MQPKRESAPEGARISETDAPAAKAESGQSPAKGKARMGSEGPEPQAADPVESQAAAAAEASDASGTEAGAADPAARVASLEAELAELNDRYLRKMADFENLRKRVAKEKEEIRLYANTELLLDLIGLLDDFDRAIGSSESSQDWKSLHDGVSMIQRAFLGRLEGRYGLKRFEGAGEAFDPNRHEALMAEERDDVDKPVVAEVLLPGYTLHERVIRASKVKVAKPAQTAGGEAETPPSSGE